MRRCDDETRRRGDDETRKSGRVYACMCGWVVELCDGDGDSDGDSDLPAWQTVINTNENLE
jgi:hypothetical protein